MATINKHDVYVKQLSRELEPKYDTILTNVPLYSFRKRKTRLVGEIDILAKKGNNYDIYEVKCSPRITKAKIQLQKIKKNVNYRVNNMFFYCGNSAHLLKL